LVDTAEQTPEKEAPSYGKVLRTGYKEPYK